MAATTSNLLHYSISDNYRNGNALTFTHYIDDLARWRDEKRLQNVIIVMDNVRFHRTAEVQEMVADLGFELRYLPPYTPVFQPIENLFSQWKGMIKETQLQNLQKIMMR
jgi:transposase